MNNQTPIAINGITIKSNGYFAYDGCHKIYICETDEEMREAEQELGYEIFPLNQIEAKYKDSCCLKFIDPFNLIGEYCPQGEEAVFTY
jgi:uncharacterized ParB-like nuclease family protein